VARNTGLPQAAQTGARRPPACVLIRRVFQRALLKQWCNLLTTENRYFLSLAIGQDRSAKGYGWMRKLSRFLPFFSKAVIHFGVNPRPAQVSPFGPRYFGRAFLPLSGWTLTAT
jgi:hypothetical protein